MKLDIKQIKAITLGALDVTESPDGIEFHRFTPAQRELYQKKREDFGYKSLASTGIKLRFRTDSKSLGVRMLVKNVRARSFFSLEVFVNGEKTGQLDNFSDVELPQYYSSESFPVGEYAKSFDLGDGDKTVTVYLPWNKRTFLQEFSLDDGATLEPVRYEKSMMAFGDSITQGYDALYPSRRYAGRLAEALDAEEFNKAIGGERFCPDLAALWDDFTPDYILVAYGTNDWSNEPKVVFNARMVAFFEELYKHYPNVKTFVVSPIWRPTYTLEKPGYKSFFDVEECIQAAIADKPNMILIPGFDLVPHDETLYADQVLHPNDKGFDHYFENLWQQVKKYI